MASIVTTELQGHVLLIGVNRPEKRNAWNLEVIDGVAAAYERLSTDDEVRAAVLFGHGEHFSAGLDLAEVGPQVAEHGPEVLAGQGEYDPFGVWGLPATKPVILAAQGIAYTLSIELALASDIVVVADDVRFCQLEIGRGIIPFGGATLRAADQLGWGNAMRYLLTAEEFGAQEAYRIGLAQEVVGAGEQLAAAVGIAERIAQQAPLGVRGTLENARLARTATFADAQDHLRGLLPGIMASQDAAEGVASFLERRPGTFVGR